MKPCCRCTKAAGFWVMAKDAQAVRRPWCLSCIDAFLDRDAVKVTMIRPGAAPICIRGGWPASVSGFIIAARIRAITAAIGPDHHDDRSSSPAGLRCRLRGQIVAAAIDTIAGLGYGQASVARIAERAGTSKGVIIDHSGSEGDLIRDLVAELSAKGRACMNPGLAAEPAGAGMLRAYIEANMSFIRENRSQDRGRRGRAQARSADGGWLYDLSIGGAGAEALRQLLAYFQGTGEFRADFDPAAAAMAIRAALDAVPGRLARDPGLDLDRYGRELADLFQLATRPEPSCPGATHRSSVEDR
jgi:TetR/AcrR family transcriptional regulator, fatty acid metabolism regulator protein